MGICNNWVGKITCHLSQAYHDVLLWGKRFTDGVSLNPQKHSERQDIIVLILPLHTVTSGWQSVKKRSHEPSWNGTSGHLVAAWTMEYSNVEGLALLDWGQWTPRIYLFMIKVQNVIQTQKFNDILEIWLRSGLLAVWLWTSYLTSLFPLLQNRRNNTL